MLLIGYFSDLCEIMSIALEKFIGQCLLHCYIPLRKSNSF